MEFDIDRAQSTRMADQHRVHMWFLASLDRINRAMQGTNDLERMVTEVLDAVLDIFECDRAWLCHPCDPDAPTWRLVVERSRPCLLYTSDAADERSSVDLGGRR